MLNKMSNQIYIFLIIGVMILIGQRIGSGIAIIEAIPGILVVLLVSFLALKIKEFTPKLKFPAFAWACLIALLLSMPFVPTSKVFLKYTNQVNFLATATPILAFAGISVGSKVTQLKKVSWKFFVVAVIVFIGTFFGSAIIAQIILKAQGII